MPGINGAEIARPPAVREANRSLKILFVSGFADTDAMEEAAGEIALLAQAIPPVPSWRASGAEGAGIASS